MATLRELCSLNNGGQGKNMYRYFFSGDACGCNEKELLNDLSDLVLSYDGSAIKYIDILHKAVDYACARYKIDSLDVLTCNFQMEGREAEFNPDLDSIVLNERYLNRKIFQKFSNVYLILNSIFHESFHFVDERRPYSYKIDAKTHKTNAASFVSMEMAEIFNKYLEFTPTLGKASPREIIYSTAYLNYFTNPNELFANKTAFSMLNDLTQNMRMKIKSEAIKNGGKNIDYKHYGNYKHFTALLKKDKDYFKDKIVRAKDLTPESKEEVYGLLYRSLIKGWLNGEVKFQGNELTIFMDSLNDMLQYVEPEYTSLIYQKLIEDREMASCYVMQSFKNFKTNYVFVESYVKSCAEIGVPLYMVTNIGYFDKKYISGIYNKALKNEKENTMVK